MSFEHLLSKPQATKTMLPSTGSFKTVCNICSVGCTLKLINENDEIIKCEGVEGLINSDGTICKYPQKGYKSVNVADRITQPLIRKSAGLVPVSWKEAFDVLFEKIKSGDSEEKAFFAGARLTNEEQYLVMKMCRAGAYSNNIGSFHYLGRGTSYTKLSRANIPFAELTESKKIYVIGSRVHINTPVAGYFIFKDKHEFNIPVEVITNNSESDIIDKADSFLHIKSYFHFIKAVNYLIVKNEMEDHEYIKNLVENFDDYKKSLLALDYSNLQAEAGVTHELIEKFAFEYRNEAHAVIVFAENELSGHTCGEIFNLALLTGKHGRTGAGLLLVKENNNTHGLHDIGIMGSLGPGATQWDDPFLRSTIQFHWRSKELPTGKGCTLTKLRDTGYESMFIFGEDPAGCALNKQEMTTMLSKCNFIMVQDYFLTATAKMADLVLPASLPFETGGTFTNSQRVIQKVNKKMQSPLQYDSWKQLEAILSRCGYDKFETIDDVTFEIASLLPKFCTSSKLLFRMNNEDNYNPMFEYGCDALHSMARN
jgi:formate dehydrogenase major subunit